MSNNKDTSQPSGGRPLRWVAWFKDRVASRADDQRPSDRKLNSVKQIPAMTEPSADLVEASAKRECIIFAGEGLSRTCGMPLWKSFVQGFIDRLYDSLILDPADAETARAAYHRGEFDRIVRALAPVAAKHEGILNEYAKVMYVKAAALSRTHDALGNVGACGVVTPNLDSLLSRCFKVQERETLTPSEADQALSSLLQGEFTSMKLRGTFTRPETLNVWPDFAMEINAANQHLRRFLEAALSSRTFIFVGTDFEEIECWLEPVEMARPERKHYALVTGSKQNSTARASALLKRYNIHPLAHDPSDDMAVPAFLDKLQTVKASTSSGA